MKDLKQLIIGINIMHHEFTPKQIMDSIDATIQITEDPRIKEELNIYKTEIVNIVEKNNTSIEDKYVSLSSKKQHIGNSIAEKTMEIYQILESYK